MKLLIQIDLVLFFEYEAQKPRAECLRSIFEWSVFFLNELHFYHPDNLDSDYKNRRIIVADLNMSALDIFRRMHTFNLSDVAIVDQKEKMVTALSTRDFRGLVDGNFNILKGFF